MIRTTEGWMRGEETFLKQEKHLVMIYNSTTTDDKTQINTQTNTALV